MDGRSPGGASTAGMTRPWPPHRRSFGRWWRPAAALVLVALGVAGAACGDDSGPGSGFSGDPEAALRRMVLQPEDLPAGLDRGDETTTTNEDLINGSPDPEAKREEVERWGRILAYETTFLRSTQTAPATVPLAVSSSSSLYKTAEGAILSFHDGRQTAEQTDWQAVHPDLKEFQKQQIERPEVADELIWLRLSGFSNQGLVVVEDYIIFRLGEERGFLRVEATGPGQDRNLLLDQVDTWLRTQVRRVREVLASPS